jgi:hypothetical protein
MKCAEYFYNLEEARDFYNLMLNAGWNAKPEFNETSQFDDENNETWVVFYNPKPYR